jgi:hypothetical protein
MNGRQVNEAGVTWLAGNGSETHASEAKAEIRAADAKAATRRMLYAKRVAPVAASHLLRRSTTGQESNFLASAAIRRARSRLPKVIST